MEFSIKGPDPATHPHPIPQSFSIIILKPYVKSVTHSEKLEWWNISMVECVTILH